MQPTREEFLRLMFDAVREFAADMPVEDDFAEALKEIEEDAVMGRAFDAVTRVLWRHGYDAAVATKFPVFGAVPRSSITGEGRYTIVYHFANMDQLRKAEQELASFFKR